MNCKANKGDLSHLALQVMSSTNPIFPFHLWIIEKKTHTPPTKNYLPWAHVTWGRTPQRADGDPVIPACAGALRGPPPRPGGPFASSGRWPASHSAASSGRRPPPPASARCGGGWPCSGRCHSGTVPGTAPWTPTRGPASGPAG